MKIFGLFTLWLRSIHLHGAVKDFTLILIRLLKCHLFTENVYINNFNNSPVFKCIPGHCSLNTNLIPHRLLNLLCSFQRRH